MASANSLAVLLVELDVLLDTRLGTVAQYWGDDIALKVLETGYHTRVCDHYEGVDKDEFQARYRNRNVDTLKHSVVSNAVSLLKELLAHLTDQAIHTPYHDGAKIIVNVYPYSLNDEERVALRMSLEDWLGVTAPIELVSLHPEQLTPSHCKQEYSMLMIYEYEHWLNIHTAGFTRARLPEVLVLAPAIYFAGPAPAAEELEKIVNEAMHPFKAAQMLASQLIGLQLIDVTHFSVLSKQISNRHNSQSPAEPGAQASGIG
jgi:hypothetical protein